MTRTWRAGLCAAGAMLLLAGCQRASETSLYGHWRAEQLRVQSLLLPIGPDLEISAHELYVPATATRLAVEGAERDGDEVTLHFKAGLGWTFRLVSDQRMVIDVPLLGPVYYQRVNTGPTAAAIPPADVTSTVAASASLAPSTSKVAAVAPTLPAMASNERQIPPSATPAAARPLLVQNDDGPLASAQSALHRGDSDTALREIDQALRTQRTNALAVQAHPNLKGLHEDPRFQALMGRYR